MKKILLLSLSLVFLFGCARQADQVEAKLKKADFYASTAGQYIEKAIQLYKDSLKSQPSLKLQEAIKLKLGSLYLESAKFPEAIEYLLGLSSQEAKKKLAVAYFKNSQQSDALAQFERLGKLEDSAYLYYYGQALEKNNLYDKALEIYSLIPKEARNYAKAKVRIQAINLSEETLSDEQVNEILKNAPTNDDYPEAGAVILLAEEEFEVLEENTAISTVHFLVKVFNERGKEEFSEIEIGYDSTFEDVKLEFARTILPDGTVTYAGDKNIRDVSIYLNYPLYSNARARIISMPEVQDGAIIEYKAKIFQKQLVNKKDFILNYSVQEGEPIKTAKFTVKIPKDRNFNYKIINSEYNKFSAQLAPKIEITGTHKILSWNLENIPEIIPEPDMPPASRINPIIMMSSFAGWQDIYQWWFSLYKDKIKINDDIKNKIQELTKDKQALIDKIRAVYNYCAQEIRYVAVEYGEAGYEPHQAQDIFKNKYGDCKDQAILLIAMLREIGANAYPVLIGTYDYLNLEEDFPSIAFNHCIAVVELDGEWIFMDPTGQTVPFRDLPVSDENRKVLLFLDDNYKIMPTPVFSSEKNYSNVTMQVKLNKDLSIYAKRSADTSGFFQHGQRYWLQYIKPKLIEETLNATANSIAPGARLLNYKIENTKDLDKKIVLEYEFQAKEFLTQAGKSKLFPQLGSIDISSIIKEERDYPVEYAALFESTITIEVEIPKGLIIKYLPQNLKIDSKWLEFENSYTKNKDKISFYQKYRLKEKLVIQSEYQEYKQLIEDAARKINQTIIVEQR